MKTFKTEKGIINWMARMDVQNYHINLDLSVDVYGDLILARKRLNYFPVKFGSIKGGFDCSENKLITLENGPEEVEGHYDCGENKLTSLKGAAKIVGKNFACNSNFLESLEFAPEKVGASFLCVNNSIQSFLGVPDIINGSLGCDYNEIKSLKYAPSYIKDDLYLGNNNIQDLSYLPKYIGGCISFRQNSPLIIENQDIAKQRITFKQIKAMLLKGELESKLLENHKKTNKSKI